MTHASGEPANPMIDGLSRVLRNATLVLPDRMIEGDVILRDGRVESLAAAGKAHGDEVWDLEGREVGPALIDTHTHGGWGVDFAESTVEEMADVAARYASAGVARLLPTLYPGPVDWMVDRLAKLARACDMCPSLVGIHLEGPFLASDRRGALPESGIFSFDPDLFDRLHHAAGRHLRVMTFAPEAIPTQYYAAIQNRGVALSIGHTSCNEAQARSAIAAGAHRATHLCNAMPPIHHRETGPVVPLLLDPRVRVEVIVDGVHLADSFVRMVLALKSAGQVIGVSDSIPLAGLGPGAGRFAGATVISDDARSCREDGTIAGSIAPLLTALRRTQTALDLATPRLFELGATAPAADLPHSHSGRLATGAPADLIVFDHDHSVLATLRAGQRVSGLESSGLGSREMLPAEFRVN